MGDDHLRRRPRRRAIELQHRSCASRTRSGLLYSAFTYYTGFKVNSGEYKLMGLAPYGEPRYADADPRASSIDLKDDGSFRLNIGLLRLLPRV